MKKGGFPATMTLVVIIIAVFALEVMTGLPITPWGANESTLVWEHGQFWRLFTAMFLHAGVLHLTVNSISLFQLGRYYELMFGTRRFLLIYFLSGLIASLASTWWTNAPSVGASGAIFGVLGAFIFSIRRSPLWRNHPAGKSLVSQAIFMIIANIILTWTIPQIDKAGHVGGLVSGLLLGAILPPLTGPPPPPRTTVIDVTPSAVPGEDPAARTDDRSERG